MASVTCNVSDIKSRLRSATSVLSSPERLPAYRVSCMSTGEAEDNFSISENAIDRDYKTFLDNLKINGKSYSLEISMGNPQRLIRLNYEQECNEESTLYRNVIYPITRCGSNEIADAEKLVESKDRFEPDRTTPCLSRSMPNEEKQEKAIDDNKKVAVDNVGVFSGSMFLVRDDNEIIRLEEEGPRQVKGEEEQEEKLKVKIEVLDESQDSPREVTTSSMHILSQDSRISVIESYGTYMDTVRNRAPSFFRNRLIDVISSPFSQSEYENLIAEARKRSPQVKLRHLRCDSIPYNTTKLGCSYFDYFPDLAKEVEQADFYKGLALMRAFFFWLKNLGHDGAFMPWFPHL